MHFFLGVKSTQDSKWNNVWENGYHGRLNTMPWLAVLGNHDYYTSPEAQVLYSKTNARWQLPSLFWEKVIPIGSSQKAVFIFVDTNLMTYTYLGDDTRPGILQSFKRFGWKDSSYVERQLKWVEDAFKRHSDKEYVFVIGHHPLGTCDAEKDLARLDALFEKYKVTSQPNV